ncbi:DUF7332 family protein [Natrinema halophilum]|uniref:Uncharacterized protein n=1 Tax=Natrinema halophilum TaxID=1699371 RepID=A0A7D5GUM3_9EURY|nr:hypothetical protein [Natrinema halophilum]QLG50789.1 hypothetical protein HYG82_19070 [Natrinema halophilum]
MGGPRLPGGTVVVLCCIVLLFTIPISATTVRATTQERNAADSPEQPATACFDGAGATYIVGSESGTHIWIRLHAAMLTDSDGAIGAELIGSMDGTSIVEIVVGLQYVGDRILDLLSPADSFELIHGFDFQLPMLEAAMDFGPDDEQSSRSTGGESGGNESSADAGTNRQAHAEDSRFELLRC